MRNNKLNQALDIVTEFINAVKNPEPITGKHGLINQVIFSHRDEGGLILSGEEAQQYRICLQQLIEVAASDERISPKAVEQLFQKAILTSLDISKRRSDLSFEERVDNAIRDLKMQLKRDPVEYQVFYPILGLSEEGLPIRVGKVDICVFGDEQYSMFREIIQAARINDEERQHWIEDLDEASGGLFGKPIGVVGVLALDEEAAYSLALKELRLTLDVINFYSDLIPYSDGLAFLPGDIEPLRVVDLILRPDDKPGYHIQGKSVGPLSPLSIQQLLKSDKDHSLGFEAISDKLARERGKLDDRLLAAVQWSGRATVEKRAEEAFLLYAIALESIILPTGDPRELTYRLSKYVAHLLGKNASSRKNISKRVGELYGVRSRIVHSGKYQVTHADLAQVRSIAKSCMLRLLTEEPFVNMKNPDELVDWFEQQILES
jgi:hypothetical protein